MTQYKQNYDCHNCGLIFANAQQLYNHTNKFCVNSGYDSLTALAQYDIKKNYFSNKKQGGAYSLGAIKVLGSQEPNLISASGLGQDMITLKKHQIDLQRRKPYQFASVRSKAQTRKNNILGNSKMSEKNSNNFYDSTFSGKMVNFQQPPNYKSPPTMGQDMKQIKSILHRSNDSIKNMPKQQKRQYAVSKLLQLEKIRDLYANNGGASKQFTKNIQKMQKFYKDMIAQIDAAKSNDASLIQSRVSTPILKLRDYQNSRVNDKIKLQLPPRNQESLVKSNNGNKEKFNNENRIQREFHNNINPYYQQNPYSVHGPPQPQIIMLPPYNVPNNSNSDAGMKMLEKMMALKSEQNKKLMQILVNQKRAKQTQPTASKKQSNVQQFSKSKYNDQNKDYHFKFSRVDDLSPQQRVLIALQQEQLDQLKLLSSLPADLQQIKMQSVAKMCQTRFQMQKQILKQRVHKMQQQEKIQYFQQQRKLDNQYWVGEQRKHMTKNQMENYIAEYQKQLNQPNYDQQQPIDQ